MANDALTFLKGEQARREAVSTFRIVGEMTFNIGYKVYADGHSNEETFFPYTEAKDRPKALATAQEFRAKAGGKGLNLSYVFIVPKSTCVRGGENWNVDQYYVREKWKEAENEENGDKFDDAIVFNSVIPHVKSGAVTPGKPFWGALRVTASPWHVRKGDAGRTSDRRSADGETTKVFPPIRVLDAVFKDRAEAEKFAGEIPVAGEVTVADPSFPGGQWETLEAWNTFKPDLVKDYRGLLDENVPTPLAQTQIAEKYICTVEHVKLVITDPQFKELLS